MATNNFKCQGCEAEAFIPEYSFNGKIYKGKDKKELLCSECQTPLSPIDKPFQGFTTASSKFSSMSPTEKGKYLADRSRQHAKKHVPHHRDI